MNRKRFIKTCGLVCVSGAGIVLSMQSCTATRLLNGKIIGDEMIVPVSEFENRKGKEHPYRKYIIVQHDILQYAICVYRFNENEYAALWMRCTHQGTELQVFGDKLQCPAHGSEFDSRGGIQSGPAEAKLRSFPVTIENDQLKISLKAV